MQRYLLFNSGCATCTQLAQAIERESNGWLVGKSLTDASMCALVKQVRPNSLAEPALLEVGDMHVRLFTGANLEMRLAFRLGLRRTWRVLRILEHASLLAPQSRPPRRTFFKGLLGSLAAIAIGGATSKRSQAAAASQRKSALPQFHRVTGRQAETLLNYAHGSASLQAFRDYIAESYPGMFKLQEEAAIVSVGAIVPGQRFVQVSIPVVGGASNSFWNLLFDDKSGEVIHTADALMTLDDQSNVVVVARVDTNVVISGVMSSATGSFLRGTGYASNGKQVALATYVPTGFASIAPMGDVNLQAVRDFKCCLNNCLASQGISALVITLTITLCSLACLIPGVNVVACAACLAVAGIGLPIEILLLCVNTCNSGSVYGGCTG